MIKRLLRNQVVRGETNLGQSTEKTVIVEALDLTFRTIERRLIRHRRLVISVVAVVSVSSLLAILFRQWLFTILWILLVPLVGGFSYFDSRTVRLWGKEILQMNHLRNLDIDLFLKTAAEFRHVCSPMLQGMLSVLSSEKRFEPCFDRQQRSLEWLTLVTTILLTSSLVCFVATAYYRSSTPLVCGFALLLSFVVLRRRSTAFRKAGRRSGDG